MILSMNLSVVLSGRSNNNQIYENTNKTTTSTSNSSDATTSTSSTNNGIDNTTSVNPYSIPKGMNILQCIDKKETLSVYDILKKVDEQKDSLAAKFNRKKVQEEEFYAQKYGNVI